MSEYLCQQKVSKNCSEKYLAVIIFFRNENRLWSNRNQFYKGHYKY